jgi:hypothetical protein
MTVREIPVPDDARALSTLPRIDYEDGFLADVGPLQARTAEGWARTMLEDAPAALRGALRSGWSALGLRLGPSACEGFVLGWQVRESTGDFVLLGAGSRIGMPAELLLMRRQDELLADTFVHLGSPMARAVWAGIEPVHRPVVRQVLEQGSRRARGE